MQSVNSNNAAAATALEMLVYLFEISHVKTTDLKGERAICHMTCLSGRMRWAPIRCRTRLFDCLLAQWNVLLSLLIARLHNARLLKPH